MQIDFAVESQIDLTTRVRQLSAMFDCPVQDRARIEFKGELPIEDQPWNVGLIVGPSGCGKSSILNRVFGAPASLEWAAKSVIDDFPKGISISDIAEICQSVGFNTIPAWMRPFAVLSNGERFRVEMARRMLTDQGIVTMDEFTSVVDRQVAKIGAHAVQRYIRRTGKQFVAASCHYDIIEWMQPDWVFEPATMHFARRSLQRRPTFSATIERVPYEYWSLFAPYHYLTAELNKAAGQSCFCLFVEGVPASFCGILHRPHPKVKNLKAVSRVVTLPDWQGLGLAMMLLQKVASAYKTAGYRFRNYPAHPSFIRSHAHQKQDWRMDKRGGDFNVKCGATSTTNIGNDMRPCAVFEYTGPAMDKGDAQRLLGRAVA